MFLRRRSSIVLGSAWAFAGAVLVIAVWLITGPTFHFSDTWQLIINTATTIITFLMVFLIQNTQNRDAKAVHFKLDEMIRELTGARNQLVDLEDLSDEDLKKLEEQFRRLRTKAERNGTRSRKAESADISREQTLMTLRPSLGGFSAADSDEVRELGAVLEQGKVEAVPVAPQMNRHQCDR